MLFPAYKQSWRTRHLHQTINYQDQLTVYLVHCRAQSLGLSGTVGLELTVLQPSLQHLTIKNVEQSWQTRLLGSLCKCAVARVFYVPQMFLLMKKGLR